MSSLLSGAAGLYNALRGAPSLVQFQTAYGETIVQFDAVMSETYSQDCKPSEFPVEDGSTIADNIVRSPLSIDFNAIVTDTPIGDLDSLVTEAATVAAMGLAGAGENIAGEALGSKIIPPIGVVAAIGAVATASWLVHKGATSRSISAYRQLVRLQMGNPLANPPTPPHPFWVVTKFGVFENMMITKLSVPREPSTGGALVFQLSVTRIRVVMPQTVNVLDVEVPALAAARQLAGEQQSSAASDLLLRKLKEGAISGDAGAAPYASAIRQVGNIFSP